MTVAMKPISILFGMAVASAGATTLAADAAAVQALPAPVFAYPPLYPYPVYTLPYYRPLAQNPYLPARPVVPQAPPANLVYPWPFFMLVPSPTPLPPAATTPSPAPAAVSPQLTPEAQKALNQAEADVRAARAAFTLWVPAENAWHAAEEAAKVGDNAGVLKQAQAIADLTRLGAEQAKYPSTEALHVSAAVEVAPVAQVAPLPPAAAAVPELSGEARAALAQAESEVQAARTNFTLWVPAENALLAAQEAAKAGDSAVVLKQAQAVADLTRLGAAQAKYPSTEVVAKPLAKRKAKPKSKPKTKPTPAKVTAMPAIAKPQATSSAAKPAVSPPPKAVQTAPAGATAAPAGTKIKPRKLCWQGDRLEECP